MVTFSQLQADVRANVIDLPTEVTNRVPRLINKAIRKLERKHNFKVMEALASGTTAASTRALMAVPADFKELRGNKAWYVTEDQGNLQRIRIIKSKEALIPIAISELAVGVPKVVLEGVPSSGLSVRNFEVYPLSDGLSDYGDGQYRVRIPYYKYLADLSADGDTNWFTENAEDWIINQATSEGFAMDWDEQRMTFWAQRAATEYNDVVKADKMQYLAGIETLVPHFEGDNDDDISW